MQGTKEIEGILRHELDNWIRWGRRRDWKPVSFKCPLGYLYKSTDVHDDHDKPLNLTCDEIGAADFERIVISLPEKHRRAFVMHHLGRAEVRGRIISFKGRDEGAKHLGVQVRQYHYLINQAHNMVLRRCQSLADMDEA